jgi:hypothetical protein
LIEDKFKQRAAEGETDSAFSSYGEFNRTDFGEEFDAEEPRDINSGGISIRIAGERLKIPIEKLKSDERIQLARSEDGQEVYLVLKDSDPEFIVGSSDSSKSLFDNLSDLPIIENVL